MSEEICTNCNCNPCMCGNHYTKLKDEELITVLSRLNDEFIKRSYRPDFSLLGMKLNKLISKKDSGVYSTFYEQIKYKKLPKEWKDYLQLIKDEDGNANMIKVFTDIKKIAKFRTPFVFFIMSTIPGMSKVEFFKAIVNLFATKVPHMFGKERLDTILYTTTENDAEQKIRYTVFRIIQEYTAYMSKYNESNPVELYLWSKLESITSSIFDNPLNLNKIDTAKLCYDLSMMLCTFASVETNTEKENIDVYFPIVNRLDYEMIEVIDDSFVDDLVQLKNKIPTNYLLG